ncbi:TIGR03943 family putative permease subunit [Herbiconiux flava]|uniref:Putative repeat protein (TIGR03943 family) n=1 Tax=Herbiconiux flava TaxID=881268 RepID=A0A852SSV0_9MICO|nr:TIGR03943 family protein [Herbiconiux flava]NYD71774.1 putative repeat protein (TIGR03943 family) [Herbiconiux flava]GLK18262.1 membrane protein [Herbiconiux flava]
MRDRLLTRWRGILLSLVGIVAIIWLAVTGQLGLYIHPRYYEFTVIMAVLAGVVVLAAFAIVPTAPASDHDHVDADHGGHDGHDSSDLGAAVPPRPLRRRDTVWAVAAGVVIAATVGALLIVPPSTLTTATVDQRDLNASAAVTDTSATETLVGSDTAAFTIKDWASLLRQGAGEDYFAGKSATLTGFVTPDPTDPDDVFYVARFVVTCCAVDAQPVGVPVYLPGWQDSYAVDTWVEASGTFGTNPSTSSSQPIVFEPADITPVDQPAEPYVY